MTYRIYCADCLEWAAGQPDHSIHAILTDPPFGLKEYTPAQVEKLRGGSGGVWRNPPSFDGSRRAPLPRFSELSEREQKALRAFFEAWGRQMLRLLVPGGHVFIAATPLLSHHVWSALLAAGFEKRGEVIRVVRTFRGGDRPKHAEAEFPETCTLPRAHYEPWGLFRKPLEGTVAENLRRWQAGALRRPNPSTPFPDLIESGLTPAGERRIAGHPSAKPQAFLRQVARAALPLGQGVLLDPFMGSGTIIAAAEAVGYDSVGIEIDPEYFRQAEAAIPRLAALAGG